MQRFDNCISLNFKPMDLFFTYFEKPHICARLDADELKIADKINQELTLVHNAQNNIAYLVKDRENLLKSVTVKTEEALFQIDIREFFYTINHTILLEKVSLLSPKIVATLKGFLDELNHNLQVEDFVQQKNIKNKCGLVLGHEVFFRLASIYLKDIDTLLNNSQKISSYYRFIDDMLVVTKYADEVIGLIESELHKLALEVNYDKLIITPPRQSFTYLKQAFSRRS